MFKWKGFWHFIGFRQNSWQIQNNKTKKTGDFLLWSLCIKCRCCAFFYSNLPLTFSNLFKSKRPLEKWFHPIWSFGQMFPCKIAFTMPILLICPLYLLFFNLSPIDNTKVFINISIAIHYEWFSWVTLKNRFDCCHQQNEFMLLFSLKCKHNLRTKQMLFLALHQWSMGGYSPTRPKNQCDPIRPDQYVFAHLFFIYQEKKSIKPCWRHRCSLVR